MWKNRLSRKLYLISYLEDFSAVLVIFAISRDLAQTGASILKMGMVGGVASLMHALSSLVFGRLSDRIGRRRLILAGTLLMTAAAACIALTRIEWAKLIFYWAVGLASGMIYPPVIAWLNQGRQADRESRGISRNLICFCLAWNMGIVSAQFSGGWLFALDRTRPIMLAVILSTINVFIVLLTGRTSSKPVATEAPPRQASGQQQALAATFTRMAWIANLGGAFAMSMMMHLLPKLAVALGVPSQQHGAILASMRIIVVATYFLLHHWGGWQYRFTASLIAQGCAIGGLTLLVFAQSAIGLALGLVGLGVQIGYNYFSSIYYSSTSGGDERRGFASGMHEATLGLGFCAGSFFGGFAGSLAGLRAPYLLAICVILALVAVQALVYVRRAKRH